MDDAVIRTPVHPSAPSAPSASVPTLPTDTGRPASRYIANAQLIRRRLADEDRTPKSKRWWKAR